MYRSVIDLIIYIKFTLQGSFLVVSIEMAYPLGSYIKPIKEEVEPPVIQTQSKQLPVKQPEKKPPSREQKPPSREVKPSSREGKPTTEPLKPLILPNKTEDLEIYERAIYIVPYKSKEFVVTLQEMINQINLEGLNIKEGGLRSLATYALSEDEKTNKKCDYVSGFEIIDDEYRMFFLEGLSEKAMKKYLKTIKKIFLFDVLNYKN